MFGADGPREESTYGAIWTRATVPRASTAQEEYRSGGEPWSESQANHRVLRLAPQHGPNPLIHCALPFPLSSKVRGDSANHDPHRTCQDPHTRAKTLTHRQEHVGRLRSNTYARTSIHHSDHLCMFILRTNPAKMTRDIGDLAGTPRITDAHGHPYTTIVHWCLSQDNQG